MYNGSFLEKFEPRRDMKGWVETQENKKIFASLSKKDKNKKSNELWTEASVTTLIIQGFRVKYH